MINHFDLVAPVYDRLVGTPDLKRLRDLLKLPTGGHMLDAGGGTGRISLQFRNLVGQLLISDLSLQMLKRAKLKGYIWPVQAHAERLPFRSESFERILAVDALHHFCDQNEAISDLLRVLKTGGRLVIEEPDINHFAVKMVALAEKLALMRSHFRSPEEIRDMISAHGASVNIESDGRFSVWIVVDK
jgi:demethylmenaquinone methyltransferase/2-methoxy-6-polyprenyl-1,4-benzoquinol methylase